MPAMHDEIDTPKIAVIGVVSALILLTLVFVVKVIYHQMEDQLRQAKDVQPMYRPLAEYQVQQQEKLHRYAITDRAADQVVIPIEQAMTLTVKELQQNRQATAAAPTPAPAPEVTKKQ